MWCLIYGWASRKGKITMPFSSSVPELIFQYNNLFEVLTATIRPLSRKQWVGGPRPSQIPARQACHIIWACEVYATGNLDGCQPRYGCAMENLDFDIPVALYPTPHQVIHYANEVRGMVKLWLESKTEVDLGASMIHERRSRTGLGHVLYVLRHATLHLGFLCSELDNRGIKTAVFH
jgi:hypothetical protein